MFLGILSGNDTGDMGAVATAFNRAGAIETRAAGGGFADIAGTEAGCAFGGGLGGVAGFGDDFSSQEGVCFVNAGVEYSDGLTLAVVAERGCCVAADERDAVAKTDVAQAVRLNVDDARGVEQLVQRGVVNAERHEGDCVEAFAMVCVECGQCVEDVALCALDGAALVLYGRGGFKQAFALVSRVELDDDAHAALDGGSVLQGLDARGEFIADVGWGVLQHAGKRDALLGALGLRPFCWGIGRKGRWADKAGGNGGGK